MGEVVKLFSDDLKDCSYFEPSDGEIGLSMRDRSLMVNCLNTDTFEIVLGDESKIYRRHEIAEFLKVAAILIDSENRWLPNLDLIGCNYT